MTLRERIEQLRSEADNAGDLDQVNLCKMALLGDQIAIAACAREIARFSPGRRIVITEAQDQED